MEAGHPPCPSRRPLTIPKPSKACHWLEMTDAENVLASMKDAVLRGM
jgi:hypothetical protein